MNGSSHQRLALVVALTFVCMFMIGCATVGHQFPVERVPDIRVGETTQAQIETIFGSPWRVGLEDGQTTWTYGHYRYKLFGQAETEDLVLRFDSRGVVVSYTFNTTEHEE